MNLATVWFSTAMALAATASVFACTATSDGDGQTGARTQAAQGDHSPPGNNGTVKIQELGVTDEIPDNDPHVGCMFQIEFRGFDEGNLNATWTLSAQPPSGKFVPVTTETVFIGEDGAGGAPDLDAVVTVDLSKYDLSSFYSHPQQGIHLKLEVHAEGSIGADTKHKVFWVEGCTPPSTSSSSGSTTSSGGSSSGGSSTSSGGSSSGKTW